VRILIVHPGPEFSVSDVYQGYATALTKIGCDVQGFNLNDRLSFYSNVSFEGAFLRPEEAIKMVNKGLLGKCYEFMPEVIVVISGFFIEGFTWDLWQYRPHAIVCIMTESPYEDDKQIALVERAQPTITLINDPTNLETYREACKRVFYMPHSHDPALHYIDPVAIPKWDFGFVGTGYPSRMEFFENVDWTGLDVRFAGHWKGLAEDSELRCYLAHDIEDCYDNTDTVVLYQHCRMSANLYRASRRADLEANSLDLAEGWSIGPREVELAACGIPFLREPRGEGDMLFPHHPRFTEPDEFGELLRWWLDHGDERTEIAGRAHDAVADRTFTNHARRMLALLP
jgi:spore maturation protein CgeB